MDAAFVAEQIVPLDTVRLIPVTRRDVGMAITAWLNSLPVRAFVASYADRLRGSYLEHHAWVIACLPVPRPLLRLWEGKKRDLRLVRRMIEISERMHENPDRPDAAKLEEELAYIVAQLYELSDEDFEALKRYWDFVQVQQSF
jgi:hypothetical protein